MTRAQEVTIDALASRYASVMVEPTDERPSGARRVVCFRAGPDETGQPQGTRAAEFDVYLRGTPVRVA